MNGLILATIVVCAGYALWPLIRLIRNQPVIFVQLKWLVLPMLLLLAQCVVTIFSLPAGVDPLLIWGYLITATLALPAVGLWAFVDRTRWSSLVLLIGVLAVIVMVVRIGQIWSAV